MEEGRTGRCPSPQPESLLLHTLGYGALLAAEPPLERPRLRLHLRLRLLLQLQLGQTAWNQSLQWLELEQGQG